MDTGVFCYFSATILPPMSTTSIRPVFTMANSRGMEIYKDNKLIFLPANGLIKQGRAKTGLTFNDLPGTTVQW